MSAREPITVSVKEFCVLSGLCRDKVFELIGFIKQSLHDHGATDE